MLFRKPEKIENIDASGITSGLYLKVGTNGTIIGATGGGGGGVEILNADTYELMNSIYPAASHPEEYCYVLNRSGWLNPFTTTRNAGLYYSNGTNWVNDVLPEAVSVQDSSGNKYVGTFLNFTNGTINSTNGTVEIDVPTKTSELNNDSNFAVDSNYIHTDNNFTDDEKVKLNNTYTKTETDNKYEYKLPSTPINPETKFLNANKEWADISIGNGGYAANLYFSTEPSDISGYYKIDYALQATETELSATLNNQELLLRTYLYDDTIGITTIDAGAWVVSFTSKVSSSLGETYLKAEVFLRHIDNSETTLFSAYSPELNNTDYLVIKTETNQSSFACLTTDRLGIRIYGKTTSTSDITINTIIGDGRASYFTAPLRLRHNQLRDLNVDNNYLHVTNTEKSVWDSKQDTLTAGTGISIIDNIVSNTQTSANWGNITGTLSNQTDLKNALDSKQNLGDYATNTSLNAHTSNTSNPHSTTASQVGAYTSSQTDTLLSNKVDKVDGKGLSTNDFTNALLTLLQQQSGENTGDETKDRIIQTLGYTPLAPNGNGSNLINIMHRHISDVGSTSVNITKTTTTTLNAGVATKILFDTKYGDNLSEYSLSTNKLSPSFSQSSWHILNFTTANVGKLTFSIYKDGALFLNKYFYGNSIIGTYECYLAFGSPYEFYITSDVANTLNPYGQFVVFTRGLY